MKKFVKKIRNILIKVPIKKSLMVIFFSIFLIPVILISAFYTTFLYKQMLDNELNKVQKSLIQTEKTFNDTLNNIRTLSDRIYVNKALQDVITKEYDNIQDVYSDYANLIFMENYLHTYSEVANIRIYTENQTLLNNAYIIKTTPQILMEKWYRTACNNKGTPFWIYEKDPITKKYYLSLIRSIWNSTNGRFTGVLVINISSEIMEKKLSSEIYETCIGFNQKMLYSPGNLSEDENQKLITIINGQNYQENIINTKLRNERVKLFAVDFYPNSNTSLKFVIMYIIPVFTLFQIIRRIIFFTAVVLILMILLSFFVIFLYSSYITKRVKQVQNEISTIVDNNFEISESIGGSDEFEMIYSRIYEMAVKTKELIDQVYIQNLEKEQIAARQSEMSFKMLSNQINPHFLFNTLETIRMKSLTSGEKEVATMLKILASLLRYNLSVRGKNVPLIDEITAIQNYLTIQHMRFGERISYDIATMCDIQNQMILPLLIQPIVENSFIHGLENKVTGGFIYILINSEIVEGKKKLVITVKDNGEGIDEEKLKLIQEKLKCPTEEDNSSIGIYNVNSRIKLFYDEGSGLDISSVYGEGTVVTMTLLEK